MYGSSQHSLDRHVNLLELHRAFGGAENGEHSGEDGLRSTPEGFAPSGVRMKWRPGS